MRTPHLQYRVEIKNLPGAHPHTFSARGPGVTCLFERNLESPMSKIFEQRVRQRFKHEFTVGRECEGKGRGQLKHEFTANVEIFTQWKTRMNASFWMANTCKWTLPIVKLDMSYVAVVMLFC